MKKIVKNPVLTFFTVLAMVIGGSVTDTSAKDAKTIMCTIFPLHMFTRNVAAGHSGVKVERLLPAAFGCPHNYSLTPRDMRRLAKADILIINGLGLEEFLGAPLERANPGLVIIDSSKAVAREELLVMDVVGKDRKETFNPHLFVSPYRAAQIVRYLAARLADEDPAGAELYRRNAEAYAARLEALANEMKDRVAGFAGRRFIQPHGAFDYLARDTGLEIVGVIQPHGVEPSAAEMINLAEKIRSRKVRAIFWEPQFSDNAARTLAAETGIASAALDPVASGPEQSGDDYYEVIMRKNLETLSRTMGEER